MRPAVFVYRAAACSRKFRLFALQGVGDNVTISHCVRPYAGYYIFISPSQLGLTPAFVCLYTLVLIDLIYAMQTDFLFSEISTAHQNVIFSRLATCPGVSITRARRQ